MYGGGVTEPIRLADISQRQVGPASASNTSERKCWPGSEKFAHSLAISPPRHLRLHTCTPTARHPHHDLKGGLLLRRDLHSLFDRELLTIDPADWTIDVAVVLDRYSDISALRGKPLQIPVELRPRKAYIEDHAKRTRAGWQSR